MKQLLIFLFALSALTVKAQTLDTVVIRNLTFQAQDWGWFVGKYAHQINSDSTTMVAFRYIRDKIRQANPASRTTNVTIDSLPGFVGLACYKTVKTANAGEIVSRYTSIVNALRGKANLLYWLDQFDAVLSVDYERSYTLGKNLVMDN